MEKILLQSTSYLDSTVLNLSTFAEWSSWPVEALEILEVLDRGEWGTSPAEKTIVFESLVMLFSCSLS